MCYGLQMNQTHQIIECFVFWIIEIIDAIWTKKLSSQCRPKKNLVFH